MAELKSATGDGMGFRNGTLLWYAERLLPAGRAKHLRGANAASSRHILGGWN
jgi:hypothetical protein